jgi:hypothetical protein
LLKVFDERTGEALIIPAADDASREAPQSVPRPAIASRTAIIEGASPSLWRATVGFLVSLVLLVGASVAILASGKGAVPPPEIQPKLALRATIGPE